MSDNKIIKKYEIGIDVYIRDLLVTYNDKYLFISYGEESENNLAQYDIGKQEIINKYEYVTEQTLQAMVSSRDSKQLYLIDNDGNLKILSINQLSILQEYNNIGVRPTLSMNQLPDNKFLIIGSAGYLRMISTENGTLIKESVKICNYSIHTIIQSDEKTLFVKGMGSCQTELNQKNFDEVFEHKLDGNKIRFLEYL